jgi:plastocyanin
MKNRKLAAGLAGVCLALGASGVAMAAHSAAVPRTATLKQSQSQTMVPNRYFKDTLRWNKDVYQVKSGGTLHIVDSVVTEGPHTFTVVKKTDRPKTAAQMNHCLICEKLGQAHGADPHSNAPPKFQFLENGVGQDTPPNVDRPGDSGLVGSGKKGESIDLKVTAKKGTTLYFMCIIHPQMQAKVIVG